MPSFAGSRNSIGGPNFFAGFGIEGIYVSTNTIFATRGTDYYFTIPYKWLKGHIVSSLIIIDGYFPDNFACFRVKSDQKTVTCRKVNFITIKSHTTTGWMQLEKVFRNFPLIAPELLS